MSNKIITDNIEYLSDVLPVLITKIVSCTQKLSMKSKKYDYDLSNTHFRISYTIPERFIFLGSTQRNILSINRDPYKYLFNSRHVSDGISISSKSIILASSKQMLDLPENTKEDIFNFNMQYSSVFTSSDFIIIEHFIKNRIPDDYNLHINIDDYKLIDAIKHLI